MGNRESLGPHGAIPLIFRLETGNAAFANDFSSWIFKESGVVKVVSSTHHRDDETEPRDQYTKKDPVVSQTSSTAQAEHGYFIPHLVVDKDVGREAMSHIKGHLRPHATWLCPTTTVAAA
jgi:hypothetical protein